MYIEVLTSAFGLNNKYLFYLHFNINSRILDRLYRTLRQCRETNTQSVDLVGKGGEVASS